MCLRFEIFLLLLFYVRADTSASPVTCTSTGVACEHSEDNLIDTVVNVRSAKECRQVCEDQEDCRFISYFDDFATQIPNICRTFQTCERVVECQNCISQNINCFNREWPCGTNIIGSMNETIGEIVDGVLSELECKQLCSENEECSWYTFFFSFDELNHDTCVLQTDLHLPIETSSSAFSGPNDCSNDFCSLVLRGENHKSLKFTEDESGIIVYVPPWVDRSCHLRVLAVGSGGDGDYGGGGSGYLDYQTFTLDIGVNII